MFDVEVTPFVIVEILKIHEFDGILILGVKIHPALDYGSRADSLIEMLINDGTFWKRRWSRQSDTTGVQDRIE